MLGDWDFTARGGLGHNNRLSVKRYSQTAKGAQRIKAYKASPRGRALAARKNAERGGHPWGPNELPRAIAMLSMTPRTCAICKIPETQLPKGLSVDHCHVTGRVRGLLCSRCNLALGLVDESPNLLLVMCEYLDPSESLPVAVF